MIKVPHDKQKAIAVIVKHLKKIHGISSIEIQKSLDNIMKVCKKEKMNTEKTDKYLFDFLSKLDNMEDLKKYGMIERCDAFGSSKYCEFCKLYRPICWKFTPTNKYFIDRHNLNDARRKNLYHVIKNKVYCSLCMDEMLLVMNHEKIKAFKCDSCNKYITISKEGDCTETKI